MSSAERGSYTNQQLGLIGRTGELVTLLRDQRTNVPGRVTRILSDLARSDQAIESLFGEPVGGKQILVVGPGQHLAEMTYFAQRNEVTGIDLDVIPQGLSWASLRDYRRMVANNGGTRTLKTLGRKAAGIDWSFRRELCRQLGIARPPSYRVMAMDATAMTFPDESFDCVYSHSCFEHIDDPSAVIRQVGRVLRPGGVAHIELHLYTSDNGCHDVRIFAGNREGIPPWSHLRPQYRDRVRPNTYLNQIRLGDWRTMFREQWTDATFDYRSGGDPQLERSLVELRQQGELRDYEDEELLTMDLVVEWKKPVLAPTALPR